MPVFKINQKYKFTVCVIKAMKSQLILQDFLHHEVN